MGILSPTNIENMAIGAMTEEVLDWAVTRHGEHGMQELLFGDIAGEAGRLG